MVADALMPGRPWTEREIETSWYGRAACAREEEGAGYRGTCSQKTHRAQVLDQSSWVHSAMDRWLERASTMALPDHLIDAEELVDLHGHRLDEGDGPACPCGWDYHLLEGSRMECRRCGRTRIFQSGRTRARAPRNDIERLEDGRWATFDPLREVPALDQTRKTLLKQALREEREQAAEARDLGTLDQLL